MLILSLEELMKNFDLPGLIAIHDRIEQSQAFLGGGSADLTREMRALYAEFMERVIAYCNPVGFINAGNKAYALHLHLESPSMFISGSMLSGRLGDLKSDLNICMFAHKFIHVESDVLKYLDSRKLFGAEVCSSFPRAVADISGAGDCIAVDLNSAAVFHLMHVAEWGLRALAANVSLSEIVTDKQKGKTIPLEYGQWEKIINQLPEKIEARVNAMDHGEDRQTTQEFYWSSLSEIRGFKDAWRNHVMHTRRDYTREDAIAVFSHVQRFMNGLADFGIKDGAQ